MRDRRELRSFGLVMLVIAAVSATAFLSCGSGGSGGGNDGSICDQCGDSDGLCQETEFVSGDDRPAFCTTDPCEVRLHCVRKLDSGQRRCFPADNSNDALALSYKCDGSRPDPNGLPTRTPTPTPTLTPTKTVTPSATSLTPTPTPSFTPSAAATPTEDDTPDFDITIVGSNEDDDLPSSFSGTVTYDATKGNFQGDDGTDCLPDDDAATADDNGSGTLTITFSGDPTGVTSLVTSCTFHLKSGQTVNTNDFGATVTNGLSIKVEDG